MFPTQVNKQAKCAEMWACRGTECLYKVCRVQNRPCLEEVDLCRLYLPQQVLLVLLLYLQVADVGEAGKDYVTKMANVLWRMCCNHHGKADNGAIS